MWTEQNHMLCIPSGCEVKGGLETYVYTKVHELTHLLLMVQLIANWQM